MQLHVGPAVFDTARRTLIIGVLSVGMPLDGHRIGLRAKESLGQGADLVEVQGGDRQDVAQACRGLSGAGILWAYSTDSIRDAANAVDAGAAVIHWLGAARDLTRLSAAHTTTTFMSSDPQPNVGDHWWVTPWPHCRPPQEYDDHPQVTVADFADETDPPRLAAQVTVADLADETDPARLAAQVTVALELGAHVLRTVAPRPVRRSAFVIRAIEAAR